MKYIQIIRIHGRIDVVMDPHNPGHAVVMDDESLTRDELLAVNWSEWVEILAPKPYPRIIYAPSINGGEDVLEFVFREETGLFHWHGSSEYAGYTEDELMSREGAYYGN